MSIIHTDDGFEFETTREGDTLTCVCRRDGREAAFSVKCGIEGVLDRLMVEQLEVIARNAWFVSEKLARRGFFKRPDGEIEDGPPRRMVVDGGVDFDPPSRAPLTPHRVCISSGRHRAAGH